MNLNILKPGNAVDSAFKKPNLALALILVLLPSLAYIGGRLLYGVQALDSAVYDIVIGYIRFFVVFLVVFALGLVLDYKKAKARLPGLFSALSLLQVMQLLFVVISILSIPLLLSPAAIDFARTAGKSSNETFVINQVTQFVEANPDAVNLLAMAIFLVIGVVLLLWGVYIVYRCIKRLIDSKPITALLLTLVAFAIIGALSVLRI